LAKDGRIVKDLGMLAKGPKYPNSTECPALKIYEEFRPVSYNAKKRLQMHQKAMRHSRIAPERMWQRADTKIGRDLRA